MSRVTRATIERWWKGAENPAYTSHEEGHTHCAGSAPENLIEQDDKELLTFEMEGAWYTMWQKEEIGFVRH